VYILFILRPVKTPKAKKPQKNLGMERLKRELVVEMIQTHAPKHT
jgi:hypothetical protein